MTARVVQLRSAEEARDDLRRRAALNWLTAESKSEVNDGFTIACASELIVCVRLRSAPSPGAVRWLRSRLKRGDCMHRSWAATILEMVGSAP